MNKKKLFLGLCLATAISTANIFAFAIGVQGGGTVSNKFLGGAAVTFKLGSPEDWVFAVDAGIGKHHFSIGGVADYWFFNNEIAGPLYWFFGLGPYACVDIWHGYDFSWDNGLGIDIGGHLPVGLNLWFFDEKFELFLQAAVKLGFRCDFRDAFAAGLHWCVPLDLGFRVHFR